MLLTAFGILCGLAAVVFATLAARPAGAVALVVTFVAGSLAFSPARFPDPSWVAGASGLAAALALWKPQWAAVAAGCGGLTAAVWAVLLRAQGLPPAGAYAVAVAFAVASAALAARRRSFAPLRLKEEALVIVGAFAVIVAAAPSVIEGFDSALGLTAERLSAESGPSAPWALLLAAAFLAAGGLYSLWRHR